MAELVLSNWRDSLEQLRERIQGVFRRWLGQFEKKESQDEEFWSPAVLNSVGRGIELDEDGHELVATAALPGLDKNDFKVEVTQGRLVIRGSKSRSAKEEGRDFSRYSVGYASFARAIALPCEIDTDRVRAKYKNGLLTIRLPKSERAKSKRIKIEVSA